MSVEEENFPDVSFSESGSAFSQSSQPNTPGPQTSSSSYRSNSPKPTNQTGLDKIGFYMEKFKKYNEYVENKKEMENLIKTDGFQFDDKGQLKSVAHDTAEGVELLNENQRSLLKKLAVDNDPTIPLLPELNTLFKLDACSFQLNLYPSECCTHDYADLIARIDPARDPCVFVTRITDLSKFLGFFDQIPADSLRDQVLDCMILNMGQNTNSIELLQLTEIISHIFETAYFARSAWYLNGRLILELLTSFGLDTNAFDRYFPNVTNKLKETSVTPKSSRPCDVTSTEERQFRKATVEQFEYMLRKLIDLFILSFSTKKSMYNVDETDFLFLLISYVIFDRNADVINFKNELQIVFAMLIQLYADESWPDKVNYLASLVCNIVLCDAYDDADIDAHIETDTENDATQCQRKRNTAQTNLLHHRIVYYLSFFEMSPSKRLRSLASKLALACAVDLLLISDATHEPVAKTDCHILKIDMDEFVDLLRQNCSILFVNSSYSMFNLVKFIDNIVAEIVFNFTNKTDSSKNMEYLLKFKDILTESNRIVKDQMDFQGRVQVKVVISNFLYKCCYYLKKYSTIGIQLLKDRPEEKLSRELSTDENDNATQQSIKSSSSFRIQTVSSSAAADAQSASTSNTQIPTISEDAFEDSSSFLNSSQLANLI